MLLSLFKNRKVINFFIGSAILFGSVSQVQAASYLADSGIGSCFGSVSIDKPSYNVGDTVVVTWSMKVLGGSEWNCSLFGSTYAPSANHTGLVVNFPLGATPPGTYPYNDNAVLTDGGSTFYGPFGVTIVINAAPTVNISFSFLNDIKIFVNNFSKQVISSFVLPAYAQTSTKTVTTTSVLISKTKGSTSGVTLLADVNIVDATSTRKDNTFTGSFILQGKLGQQNDILYGVLVVDEKDQILDAKVLNTVSHINQDEIQKYSYSYTLPATVHGNVRILLTADTKEGLTLSSGQVYSGTISGVKVDFPCEYVEGTKTSKRSVECMSPNNESVVVEYHKGSVFTSPVHKETVELADGKKVTLNPVLPAGEYFVTVTTSANEKRIFPYTKEGVYGVISSVVVHTGDKIGEIKTVVFSNVSTSSIVSFNLAGKNGESCGSGNVEAKGMLAVFTLSTKCAQGVVTVTLKDRQGHVLSTSSQPFSVLSVNNSTSKDATSSAADSSLRIKIVCMILFIILIIAVSSVYFRNKNRAAQIAPVIPLIPGN